ncbi:MAG: hypothetical protein M1824_002635 [Vezdaea acicularis]|nr:MAG: hypothetical protein M1824_002635 [Vezdaea acicularis]
MSPSAQAFSRHAPSEPAIPQSPVSPMEGSPPPTTALPPLPDFASHSQTRDQGLSGIDHHENSTFQTVSRNTSRYSYLASPTPPPLDREHPAFSAPYAEPQPLKAECPQAEPLPDKEYAKPPIPQTSEKKVPFSPDHVQVPVLSPRTPTTPYHPTYDPPPSTNRKSTAPGPHQPGQIPHPNMAADSGWKHGLCEFGDIGICCTGLWCPCILYGKTQYRLSQKDPTDLLGYKTCNGSCGIMCVAACGFQCELPFPTKLFVSLIDRKKGSSRSSNERASASFTTLMAASGLTASLRSAAIVVS